MLKNDFMLNQTLENDHCYIDLRPTVDTSMIPHLSYPVLRTNRMHNYVYAMIKFHTYSDIISV